MLQWLKYHRVWQKRKKIPVHCWEINKELIISFCQLSMRAGSRSQYGTHTHLLKPQQHPNVQTILQTKSRGQTPKSSSSIFSFRIFTRTMRSKAAQGLPGRLINPSHFLLRGCVWDQGKKNNPTCRIGRGRGALWNTTHRYLSVFSWPGGVGWGVHLRLKHRALGKCRVIGRAN